MYLIMISLIIAIYMSRSLAIDVKNLSALSLVLLSLSLPLSLSSEIENSEVRSNEANIWCSTDFPIYSVIVIRHTSSHPPFT